MKKYQEVEDLWGSTTYPQTKPVGDGHYLWKGGPRIHDGCGVICRETGERLKGEDAFRVVYDHYYLSNHMFDGMSRHTLTLDMTQHIIGDMGYGISPCYAKKGEKFPVRHPSSRWQSSGGESVLADSSHTRMHVWDEDGRLMFAG